MKSHIFLILTGINILNADEITSPGPQSKPLNKSAEVPSTLNVFPDANGANPNPKFIPSNMGERTSNAQTNLTYNNHTNYSENSDKK